MKCKAITSKKVFGIHHSRIDWNITQLSRLSETMLSNSTWEAWIFPKLLGSRWNVELPKYINTHTYANTHTDTKYKDIKLFLSKGTSNVSAHFRRPYMAETWFTNAREHRRLKLREIDFYMSLLSGVCHLKVITQHKRAAVWALQPAGTTAWDDKRKLTPSDWVNFHSKQPQLTSLSKSQLNMADSVCITIFTKLCQCPSLSSIKKFGQNMFFFKIIITILSINRLVSSWHCLRINLLISFDFLADKLPSFSCFSRWKWIWKWFLHPRHCSNIKQVSSASSSIPTFNYYIVGTFFKC